MSEKKRVFLQEILEEGDIGVCGTAQLFCAAFLVHRIPPCGIAVISNPTVCGLCF